jgi:hypothetical protein
MYIQGEQQNYFMSCMYTLRFAIRIALNSSTWKRKKEKVSFGEPSTPQFSAAGAGNLYRHLSPQIWVAIMARKAPAMMAAWHPKVTAGPLWPTHLSWKYTTQKPPVFSVGNYMLEPVQYFSWAVCVVRSGCTAARSAKHTCRSPEVDPRGRQSGMMRETVQEVC